MRKGYEAAESAREREQRRQASYYSRKVKKRREFKPGDRVWVYRPLQDQKQVNLPTNIWGR